MINNKNFEHRPISELMAIVKRSLRRLDDEGLISEGAAVKAIMQCNERLGLGIREVRQVCIPVMGGKAVLPKDFEKLYYICALPELKIENHEYKNPFDNSFDRDIVYEAEVNREKIGNAENYQVVIKKVTNLTIKTYTKFIELELAPASIVHSIGSSPINKKNGKKQVTITDDGYIECPFEEGELYLMYVATLKDKDGRLLFPFHPMITPYYEWAAKEQILTDAVYNSDGNYFELLKDARQQKAFAWVDAFNVTTDREYGDYIQAKKKREMEWWNTYFKNFM